ncbi:hypothetical protein EDD37DRAFT_648246 [Exophiala viscosa]|uniref:Uncharacterized protein n=1 Tax=Exophiala viscosa TaxID=2486360 RepID=A0AAN6DV91_9EURO|nr:hypothetical protein EDD36DRAFT_464870 [Exophiala viscosa]KAI1625790.1 hypothetical protein EDD37DRAFT_648246 [Exophiala viscosa]
MPRTFQTLNLFFLSAIQPTPSLSPGLWRSYNMEHDHTGIADSGAQWYEGQNMFPCHLLPGTLTIDNLFPHHPVVGQTAAMIGVYTGSNADHSVDGPNVGLPQYLEQHGARVCRYPLETPFDLMEEVPQDYHASLCPGSIPYHFLIFERRTRSSKMKFPWEMVFVIWRVPVEIVIATGEGYYHFAKWRMLAGWAKSYFQSEWTLMQSELQDLVTRATEHGHEVQAIVYRLLLGSFKDMEIYLDGDRLRGKIVHWVSKPRYMELPASVIFEVHDSSKMARDRTHYMLTKLTPKGRSRPPVRVMDEDLTFDSFVRLPPLTSEL